MEELVLDEVYDIWPSSFWNTLPGYALITTAIIAAMLLVYGLIKLIHYYRQTSTKERALASLKKLGEKVQKGSVDAHKAYHELTNIIKGFTHWRYGLPRGMTDYELSFLLTQQTLDKGHQEIIERIVVDAQAVKFGKLDVLKQQIQKDISDSIAFVEIAGNKE
jgi:hypothetical protein